MCAHLAHPESAIRCPRSATPAVCQSMAVVSEPDSGERIAESGSGLPAVAVTATPHKHGAQRAKAGGRLLSRPPPGAQAGLSAGCPRHFRCGVRKLSNWLSIEQRRCHIRSARYSRNSREFSRRSSGVGSGVSLRFSLVGSDGGTDRYPVSQRLRARN
jgi:hypothetical protein